MAFTRFRRFSLSARLGITLLAIVFSLAAQAQPVANDDNYFVDEDTQLIGNVTDADGNGGVADNEGAGLTTDSITVLPSGAAGVPGTLILDRDTGAFTYDPLPDSETTVTFQYTITDSAAMTSLPATVTIDINPVPDGVADSFSTNEDTQLSGNVVDGSGSGGTPDDLGDGLAVGGITVVTAVASGVLNMNSNTGAFTYDPAANATAAVFFEYTITDTNGDVSGSVRADIAIDAVPDGVDDSFTTDEDTQLSGNVVDGSGSGGTPDDLGDGLAVGGITVVTAVASGVLNMNSNTGAFTYDPAANATAAIFFEYTITGNNGNVSDPVRADIAIDPVPDGVDDSFTTDEDTQLSGNVVDGSGSGGTPDDLGDGLAAGGISVVTAVASGVLNMNSNTGAFTYDPAANATAAVFFEYTITDTNGDVSGSVRVDIAIDAVPDGVDDTFTTDEDTRLSGNVVDGSGSGGTPDDVGDGLFNNSITVFSPVTAGTLQLFGDTGNFNYDPAADATATVSFQYTITDNNGDVSSPVTVTINIDPVPDPVDDFFTPEEDLSPLTGNVLAANPSTPDDVGDGLGIVRVQTPVNQGVLNLNEADGSFQFDYPANFDGIAIFTYTITDNNGDESDPATVTIDIDAAPDGVNDSYIVDEDTRLTANVVNGSGSGGTPDDVGDGLGTNSITLITPVASGVLNLNRDTGAFTYDPAPNATAPIFFEYTITDIGPSPDTSAPVRVDIAIDPVPDTVDDLFIPDEDASPFAGNVTEDNTNGADDLGDGLGTVTVLQTVGEGTLNLDPSDGSFQYIYAPNFDGVVTFTYTVTDSNGDVSAVTTATIDINAIADPTDDLFTPDEDTSPLGGNVTSDNGSDIDDLGDGLGTVNVVTTTTMGTLALNPVDGSFTYEFVEDFDGQDSFTYTITDANGDVSPEATVSINIDPVPDGFSDIFTVDEDTQLAANVIVDNGNGADDLGDGIGVGGIQLVTPVLEGTLDLNVDTGDFTYDPAPNATSAVFFEYSITDIGATPDTSGPVRVDINIDPVPDPADDIFPIAPDLILEDGTTFSGNVDNDNGNGPDDRGDDVGAIVDGISLVTDVTSGVLSLSANGEFTYDPNDDFFGDDSFTYEVTDDNGDAGTAQVTLTVTPVNDQPTFGALPPFEAGAACEPQTIVPGFMPNISAGPDNESDQTFTTALSIMVSQPSGTLPGDLFSELPSIDPVTGTLTYTGSAAGLMQVTVSLTDSGGTDNGGVELSDSQMFLLTLDGSPTVQDDFDFTDEDAQVIYDLRGATACAGTLDVTSVQVINPPANGSTSVDPVTGFITYTPNNDFFSDTFFEPDSFVYQIADSNGDTSSATVSVLVRAVPDAVDDGVIDVLGDGLFTTPNLLLNDESGGVSPANVADVDLTLTDTLSTQGGTVVYNGDGTFNYTPPANFVGMDSFSYGLTRAENATGQDRSDTANVMLSVFQASSYTLSKFWPNTPYPVPFRDPDSFVVDNLGFVYVRDREQGRIFKLSPSAQLVGSFADVGASAGQSASLTADDERNIYSVSLGGSNFQLTRYTSDGLQLGCLNNTGAGGCSTLPAGVNLSTIRDLEFSPEGTLLLVAGTGQPGVHRLTLDLEYLQREVEQPSGSAFLDIAAGSDGVIYTLTQGASLTIERYTAMGNLLGQFPGTISTGDSYDLRFGRSAGQPRVALLTNDNSRVNLTVFNDIGTQITGVDLAGLLESSGLVFDRFGNLLIGVPGRFARYTLFGQLVEEVGFSGTTPGRFDMPGGLDVTAAGDLIVADTNNARVQFFDDVTGQLLSAQNLNASGVPVLPKDIAAHPTSSSFFVIDQDRLLEFVPGSPSAVLLNNAPLPCSPSELVMRSNGNLIFDCDSGLLFEMPASGVPAPLVVVPGTTDVLDLSIGDIMGSEQLLGLAQTASGDRQIFQIDLASSAVEVRALSGSLATNAVALELLGDQTLAIAEDDFSSSANASRVVRTSLLGTVIDQPAGPGTGPLGVAEVAAVRRLDAMRFAMLDLRLGRVQIVESTTATFDRRAVVVAGGGPYAGNNLWDATQVNANLAYRTLLFRGYRKQDITYLSADFLTNADIDSDGVADDIDGFPTAATIEAAIMALAGADEAVVYLADHGDNERFRVNGLNIPAQNIAPETLGSATLGSWLDNLDASASPGQLTVIYEACESGSFLDNIDSASPSRVVMTTTNTGQDAKFISQGYLSFSTQFWSEIFDGGSVGDAYQAASGAVGNQTIDQDPQLDANGNDIGNEATGDLDQLNYFIGGDTSAVNDSPSIDNASLQLSGALDVVVSSPQDVARAWAVVRPPMLATGASDNPVIGLPEIELSAPLGGCGFAGQCTFSGVYDGFVAEGMYSVEVLLRDTSGYLTRFEVPLTANITTPERRRAVIVAGFSADSGEQQRIENAASFVYSALLQQGYQDNTNGIEDIRFLSAGTSGITGVDQQLTRAALEFTFTQWATEGLRDLTVYFVGRTQGSSFLLGPGDLLTASDIDVWFDALQEGLDPALSGTLMALFEGNTAGQLLPAMAGVPGRPRIVISSTGLAENAVIFTDTDPLFTRHFWTGIANGAGVGESFDIAGRAVRALASTQMPMLDDGGGVGGENDGRANGPMDGLVARAYNVGPGVRQAGNAPLIGAVSDNVILTSADNNTATLQAMNVSSTQQSPVMTVFAAISPPSPFANQQFVDLLPTGGDNYAVDFDGFDLGGTYSVAIFAVDDDENISVQQEMTVTNIDAPDGFEVDNTRAQASVFFVDASAPQFHSLHTSNDEDWVRFFGRAAAVYSLRAANLDSSGQLRLTMQLLDEQENVLFSTQGLAGSDVALDLGPGASANTLPADGQYFLRISADSGAGSGAFYELVAFQPLGAEAGRLDGRVVDGVSGASVPGAVIITSDNITAFSNQIGDFSLASNAAAYSITITAPGFQTLNDTYDLSVRETTTRLFSLTADGAGLPSISLRAPSDVTTASATLLADVDPAGELTGVSFRIRPQGGEFGLPLSASSVSTPLRVGRAVDGLLCSSSFEFEATASNSSGSVTDGPQTFSTLDCVDPPVLSNLSFANVTDATARIQVTVDTTETAVLEYRLRPAGQEFGDYLPAGNVSGTGVQVTVDLDSLICETAFDFQFRGTNSGGVVQTSLATLTTASCVAGIPEVTTGSADQITEISARLNGLVDGQGGSVDVQFDFGPTTAYGNVVLLVGVNAAGGQVPVSANVSGLECGTEYHFRVRGTNAQGQRVGFDRVFNTTVCPREVDVLLVDDDASSPDVVQTYVDSLIALGVTPQVQVTNGDAAEPTAMDMQAFDVVLWVTGNTSDAVTGPSPQSETEIGTYLAGGGCFAISSEGWLAARGGGSDTPTTLMQTLGLASGMSDVNPITLTGRAPGFDGLGPYDLGAPLADLLEPRSDASVIFEGNGGGAALLRRGERGDGLYFGFDLSTLSEAGATTETLERTLDFCESRLFDDSFETVPATGKGVIRP
ncbi:MAG: tandem-95 repeat protein [Lysobacterales bacterium]